MFTVVLVILSVAESGLSIQAQSVVKVSEPEYVDIFYAIVDGRTDLVPLERQQLKYAAKSKPGLFSSAVSASYFVAEQRSPVRFETGTMVRFVVRVQSREQDPQILIKFFRFIDEPGMRLFQRQGVSTSIGRAKNATVEASLIPFSASKYGEKSFSATPSVELEPGEYVLTTAGGKLLYCFGVDEKK
ncbi:MAG: hypothetical protein IPM50_12675 [Acidobacteriota bacterium]|nr:MAG: hypothetical protein IPM50_12675 [Acidobacteriota bacterium]